MKDNYEIKLSMDNMNTPKHFNDSILSGIRKGYTDFNVFINDKQKTYPNICVPVAGITEYYRNLNLNITFTFPPNELDYIKHTAFGKPYIIEDDVQITDLRYPLDKVWKFSTSEGVNAIVTAITNSIRESEQLVCGVLNSIEWCLNEVMDNVLQHSESPYGLVMVQLHKATSKLSICVFDSGRGIYNSLKNSKHRPHKPLDAITLALQERVTRDERVGQGNGMWGLSRIIDENKGGIKISSCGAVYSFLYDKVKTVESGYMHFGKENGTTLVDFQIDYSKSIDISKALNSYKPVDLWLENRELDSGEFLFKVSEDSAGTGTRKAALRFKNIVLNTLRENNKKIILDFEKVNLVSSSYADELIGKIISDYGFVFFINNFEIRNITELNIGVINRSVEQRMAQSYYDSSIEDDQDVTTTW
ncbi:MAG: DUF4325 domain-containing protein [Herbinix sp.]|nr:DUF4325 domain-containing protein [Herbinix sp.]